MSYEPQIYRQQGGSRLVVGATGELNVINGGKMLDDGTQASAIADLTAASGTADGTVADVTASFSQTILNNNFQDLSTKINLMLAAMRGVGMIAP